MRVLVDVDGVLADMTGPLLEKMRARGLNVPGKEGIKVFNLREALGERLGDAAYDVLRAPGFARHLPVIEGAQRGVQALREAGFEVVYVTAPFWSSLTWVNDRMFWLKTHFGVQEPEVVMTDNKALVSGDFLIDDKVANLEAFESLVGCTGVCFDQPWNQGWKFDRVRSWEEVMHYFKGD